MEFKIGNIVKLKSDAKYLEAPDNPRNMIGNVVEIDCGYNLPIRVCWDNGEHNVYTVNDLNKIDLEVFSNLGTE